jgi:hypothetical protein
VKLAQLYPCFFTEADVQELEKPSTVEEIKLVLNILPKDKIPEMDIWMVDFFLKYFDLIGEDIHEVVEESRSMGMMVSALNSTFLVTIQKVDKPTRFGEFIPISLCNLAYKVIEKLIGIRLKPLLSKVLS